ncbi:MAG TPA: D-alanyl-D-alanine carboxypeptidase family protein [Acidocella sp.]|nr:D-alanyl-D-alanine carboxypeptidase family protein [Acidocella sp.]
MRGWRGVRLGDWTKNYRPALGFALAACVAAPASAHTEHVDHHVRQLAHHYVAHHDAHHAERVAQARHEAHHLVLHHEVRHHEAVHHDIVAASAELGPTSPGPSKIVIDATTGRVLLAQGADTPRYPASLTKLMTLDLAFEALRDHRLSLDTEIPVSDHAASVEPVKLDLRPGTHISVRDAILAMTTMSANDAATALGEYLGGGSEIRCAQMMTLRAHALGMAQTQFANASGLPNPNQVTTARDLALLARDLVEHFPEDQYFFETRKFDFHGRIIPNINGMLKLYPGATGMKTGYTDLARHNVITSADRDGHVLIGVVLHEPSWPTSYRMMTAMLDRGFAGTGLADAHGSALAAAEAPRDAGGEATGRVEQVASRGAHPAAPLALGHHLDSSTELAADGSWTAQLATYDVMRRARVEAIAVRQKRGIGIPRIGRVEHHGHTLWTAQLAGLSHEAAVATCSALAAQHQSCLLIAPNADHLADRSGPDGFGT